MEVHTDRRPVIGLVAVVIWAVAFGAVHIAWAGGSRVLIVDTIAADAAFDLMWFRAYNLVVAVASLLIAAAATVLARLEPAGWQSPARVALWIAGGLLTVRGAIGAAQLIWSELAADRQDPLAAWGVDLYMFAGGVLLLGVARLTSTAGGRGQRR